MLLVVKNYESSSTHWQGKANGPNVLFYLNVVFTMIQLVTRPSPEVLRENVIKVNIFLLLAAKYQKLLTLSGAGFLRKKLDKDLTQSCKEK